MFANDLSIDSILEALNGLSESDRRALVEQAEKVSAERAWTPNPGPQTEAYFSEADEVFYGGQAGGGKTDLEIGLSLTEHRRSLLLRRTNKEALGLVERMAEIVGNRDGWSGQAGIWRLTDRTVEISGCQLEEDKQKFKGAPHDLICFDEVSDFTESQYTFIIGWNRSAIPGQRCRVLSAGNPPTRPEGLWVLRRWGAWLDPTHPNPARPGELRWYTTGADGTEIEVDGPGPHIINGEAIIAMSRTFIPATLADNPDLKRTNYASVLAAMPEELRRAYRDGQFDAGLKDSAYQVIPSSWVKMAQERWHDGPGSSAPMCALGVDASGGGKDPMKIAIRYGGWYDKLVTVEGKDIPIDRQGAYCAGIVLSHRKHDATIVVDMGGGYGGAMFEKLCDNGIRPYPYKGAEAALGKDRSGHFGFHNKRSWAIWKFREALDPDQEGGSQIALPPSPQLIADLTAPTYSPDSKIIKVESKEDVCKRLGRSTNEGDAVVMAWCAGIKQENLPGGFKEFRKGYRTPTINVGRSLANKRR